MIEVNHCKQIGNVKSSLSKLDETKLKINITLLNKDIDRLENEKDETKNKFNKKNIEALITYLKKVRNCVERDKGYLTVCWTQDTHGEPKSYPVDMIDEPLYNISICNYIEVSSGNKAIIINMMDIADVISYELMYRDLCDELEDIEERLDNAVIVGYNDISMLTAKFKADGDNMYYLSKTMKIEDTAYYCSDNKTVFDYFMYKEFSDGYYRNVVQYSCKSAAEVIASTLIKNLSMLGIKTELIMAEPTCVALMAEDKKGNLTEDTIDDISILAFGRKFRIDKRKCITIL